MSKIEVIRAKVNAYVSILLKFGYRIDMTDGRTKTRGNQLITFTINEKEHSMKMWDLTVFFRDLTYSVVDEYIEIANKHVMLKEVKIDNTLTIDNITNMIDKLQSTGGTPNFMPIRCPNCGVIYTYAYVGYVSENPNFEVEHHKKDCYFNKMV